MKEIQAEKSAHVLAAAATLAIFVLMAHGAVADTHTAANSFQAAVLVKINALSGGDTVIVPAGTASCTGAMTFSPLSPHKPNRIYRGL